MQRVNRERLLLDVERKAKIGPARQRNGEAQRDRHHVPTCGSFGNDQGVLKILKRHF